MSFDDTTLYVIAVLAALGGAMFLAIPREEGESVFAARLRRSIGAGTILVGIALGWLIQAQLPDMSHIIDFGWAYNYLPVLVVVAMAGIMMFIITAIAGGFRECPHCKSHLTMVLHPPTDAVIAVQAVNRFPTHRHCWRCGKDSPLSEDDDE